MPQLLEKSASVLEFRLATLLGRDEIYSAAARRLRPYQNADCPEVAAAALVSEGYSEEAARLIAPEASMIEAARRRAFQ
jgi:hypothetical protein